MDFKPIENNSSEDEQFLDRRSNGGNPNHDLRIFSNLNLSHYDSCNILAFFPQYKYF